MHIKLIIIWITCGVLLVVFSELVLSMLSRDVADLIVGLVWLLSPPYFLGLIIHFILGKKPVLSRKRFFRYCYIISTIFILTAIIIFVYVETRPPSLFGRLRYIFHELVAAGLLFSGIFSVLSATVAYAVFKFSEWRNRKID